MNKKEINRVIRRLSSKIFFQLILTEIAYLFLLYGGLFLGVVLSSWVRWYSGDLLYQFLISIANNILPIMFILTIGGMLFILYFYWKKTVRYIEFLIEASNVMMDHREDTQIVLPDELELVQRQMNQQKIDVLRSERAAKEAEQRKNDLIVYLAHDLKTPLTSVIGYLSLLEDEQEISLPLRQKYTNIAREKAERLEELINEFFEITRFNLTTLTLEVSHLNLSRMLQQLAYEFQPLANEKQIQFELKIQANMNVLLDIGKIERVFDNLIRNAINYSYEKGTLLIEANQDENQGIHLKFENNGNTIPPEKLARLFDQFYRLDSSRGTKNGGAGLGLAIAKEIVELHQGTIEVTSADEKITFSVFLPQLS